MSGTGRQRRAKVIKWVARVFGLAGVVFFPGLLLDRFLSSQDWIVFGGRIFFAGGMPLTLGGLIISWWKTWLAGVLLILSSVSALGMFIYLAMNNHPGLSPLIFGSPSLVAGVLFLLSWRFSNKARSSVYPLREENRKQMASRSRNRLGRILRIVARILGLTITGFFLLAIVSANLRFWLSGDFRANRLFLFQDLPGILSLFLGLAACIISWRRVGLAGILLIVAAIVIDAVMIPDYLAGEGAYILFAGWGYAFLPLLTVGILFLLSWWLSKKTSPPATSLS